MAIRADFQEVEGPLNRLLVYGRTFDEFNGERWPHYRSREDFEKVFELSPDERTAYEDLYCDGRDCAVTMSAMMGGGFNDVRRFPTLRSYVAAFEGGWVYQTDLLKTQLAEVIALGKKHGKQPWAVGAMAGLYQSQIEMLEAAAVVFEQLKKTPLYRREGGEPFPALNDDAYEEILTFLAGMSVAIERSPSTFANIGEEPLRDWFLVALNGSFKGGATGETFNREGKTDIAIRVDGNVSFIAECKFWGGEKMLLATIDQLLGYLTWRDSKAGILLFSRNADFTAVLAQIKDVVGKHPNFVNHLSYASETGFRFALKNKTDPGREHVVTLLTFHVPKVS